MKRSFVYVVLLLLTVLGCSASKSRVVVEDFVVGAPYEITKVDGMPVERIEHGMIVTKAPFVVMSEGIHELTLKFRSNGSVIPAENQRLRVQLKSGSRYRIGRRDGMPVLDVVKE